ncbi:MAG: ribonuclease J [Chloroflexi bacterium]|jgi:ribonuclease J|nr:MAG: ribonuclease J [Chloroflexota bacterium]
MGKQTLKVIPLGGLGEIGKNMMALESGRDIIIIDSGVLFPQETMPGVDLVIPDISYLIENKGRIRGIFITHGHEDHTGALPYVLQKLQVPVYASRLAVGLIKLKLKDHKLSYDPKLVEIKSGEQIKSGLFKVTFFPVSHSIPDAMGLAISTPLGLVIHTGDFKIDLTPATGNPTNLGQLAEICRNGTFLLLSDSTYANVPGYTPSENVVSKEMAELIGKANGRVLIATFASLLARIQQIVDTSHKYGKKLSVVGRSMVNNVNLAIDLGYISDPGEVFVPVKELRKYPPEKSVILMTGSQGEPTSALTRIANRAHHDIEITPGDTVVVSSSPIPGNELPVSRVIDNLFRQGAYVLYDKTSTVHVHGHASQEELKLVLNITRPKFFVPVHGEFRHLVAHRELAIAMGVQQDKVFILENGDLLELSNDKGWLGNSVPAGNVYVDGNLLWAHDSNVLKERTMLSRDGIVIVSVSINKHNGAVMSRPRLASVGFIERSNSPELLERAADAVLLDLKSISKNNPLSSGDIESKINKSIGAFLFQETRLRPQIISFPVLT